MQMTYHVTCKCGHDFPIPARFLGPDEDERTALLKALGGLHCPNCIKAAVAEVHALREHLLETGAVPLDITEEGWKSLARDARRDILREDIIPPPPPRSPDISDEIMRYPETLPKDLHQTLECPDKSPYSWGERETCSPAKDPRTMSELTHQLDVTENWNRNYPVGTEVLVTRTGEEQPGDLLAYHTYQTTSPARLLAGKPVVEVKGLGPIDLDRLIPFFA